MEEAPKKPLRHNIGAWRVVRLLGTGGMAEVYEVEDVRLGIRYALKLFTYVTANRPTEAPVCGASVHAPAEGVRDASVRGVAEDVRDDSARNTAGCGVQANDPVGCGCNVAACDTAGRGGAVRGTAEGARARFISEGRLLAKLDHPRLVRVYDVDEDAETGCPYFVMDLVLDPDGRPRTLAEVEAPDEERVAMWYEDLRDGLDYIHGRGILHRDLKLQNVLVGPDGHVVLSDFGIAKIFDPALRADLGLSAEQTLIAERGGRKTVMGSVGYMAPEVEMGVAASRQSDWYALGVLVFRLLTGVWCDARTDVVADLETFNPTWQQILPKLLHLNPSGRACPSFAALERARREEEAYRAEKALAEARDKLRRAKTAKKRLAAALGAAFAALLALGAFLAFDPFAKGVALPPFEELCPIPAGAPSESDGDAPSRADYELAQIDAWVVTHGLLADVSQGRMSRTRAVEAIRRLAHLAAEDDDSVFAGHADYAGAGESDVLARLLEGMADRLGRKGAK